MTLLRSTLYLPAANPRALEKARHLPCDALIFDLEDAVLPAGKPAARAALAAALGQGGYAPRLRLVRVNAGAGQEADLRALAELSGAFDGLVLPKVAAPEDLGAARRMLPGAPLWAMIETPVGVLEAARIARAPGLAGLILGSNDLARALRCESAADRTPLLLALQTVVLAARAAGVACLDGVFNALADESGLEAECRQGRALGFDGKTLIHPAQIAIANRVFAPAPAELAHARRLIAAFAAAEAQGQGVAVLDGRLIEALHVATARRLLAQAAAIAARADTESDWAGRGR